MIYNLRFYVVCCIFGFLLSLYWWDEDRKKIRFPWELVLIASTWILVGSSMIYFVNKDTDSFWSAIPNSLDFNHFFEGYIRYRHNDYNALAFFSVAFFTAMFRWIWIRRNYVHNHRDNPYSPAYQDSGRNRHWHSGATLWRSKKIKDMDRFDKNFHDSDPETGRPFSYGHPDGVWIICLAFVSDPSSVSPAFKIITSSSLRLISEIWIFSSLLYLCMQHIVYEYVCKEEDRGIRQAYDFPLFLLHRVLFPILSSCVSQIPAARPNRPSTKERLCR